MHSCAASRLSLESRLRSLLREPPDLLLAVSPEGQPLFVSSRLLADGRVASPLHQSILEHLLPQDREPFRRSLRQAIEKRISVEIEVRKFKLIEAKGPVVLTVEPVVTMEGVLALSVKAAARENPGAHRAQQ
jgi:hypothetical protein